MYYSNIYWNFDVVGLNITSKVLKLLKSPNSIDSIPLKNYFKKQEMMNELIQLNKNNPFIK
jgi:hypothetical protein